MIHEQVMVKVNAPVDRGVASLVEALSSIPNLITSESCEGDSSKEAFVSFHVDGDWRALAQFVHDFSKAVSSRVADIWYSLSVEWYAGGERPLAYVRVPHQHIEKLSEAISKAGCAAV